MTKKQQVWTHAPRIHAAILRATPAPPARPAAPLPVDGLDLDAAPLDPSACAGSPGTGGAAGQVAQASGSLDVAIPGHPGRQGRRKQSEEDAVRAALRAVRTDDAVLAVLAHAVDAGEQWAVTLWLGYLWGRPVERARVDVTQQARVMVDWLVELRTGAPPPQVLELAPVEPDQEPGALDEPPTS